MSSCKKKSNNNGKTAYFAPWEENIYGRHDFPASQPTSPRSMINQRKVIAQQATSLPVCGDLSGTRIHSVSHNAKAPIINHENGVCVLGSSADLNDVLRKNNANFGPHAQNGQVMRQQPQQQPPYATTTTTNTLPATANGNNNYNNNGNVNNSGNNNNNHSNITTTNANAAANNYNTQTQQQQLLNNAPVATMSRATAAPLSTSLTAAAANALAPVATAAQNAAAATVPPAANGQMAPIAPATAVQQCIVKQQQPCCVWPWIVFLILAGIAIAVILAVIFGHKDANKCGRTVDYFGTKKMQCYVQQQQQQALPFQQSQSAAYGYASAPTPTPAQQATLAAQQSVGSISQDFSNLGATLGADLRSILQ